MALWDWSIAPNRSWLMTKMYFCQSRGLPGGLFPVGPAWCTSLGRHPEGILLRCPNHFNWLLSTQRNSDSTLRPSWMTELLTLEHSEKNRLCSRAGCLSAHCPAPEPASSGLENTWSQQPCHIMWYALELVVATLWATVQIPWHR